MTGKSAFRAVYVTLLCDEDGADIVEGYLTKAKKGSIHLYMSFADSLIAATAIHYDALLVHKDPEFEPLKGIVQMDVLPYKNRQ